MENNNDELYRVSVEELSLLFVWLFTLDYIKPYTHSLFPLTQMLLRGSTAT